MILFNAVQEIVGDAKGHIPHRNEISFWDLLFQNGRNI